jgi:hypothetical protein
MLSTAAINEAGIMGFKESFHKVSVAMGSRLVEGIKAIRPERRLAYLSQLSAPSPPIDSLTAFTSH